MKGFKNVNVYIYGKGIEKKSIGFDGDKIAYIGDDLNDYECMKYCGLTGCPQDATQKIKEIVSFVAPRDGGKGAVRDFIEYIAAL
jgi:3-deoxy-D-manno-octulosonate 8-phosphate phosphatase (KDO 8-P phosphatase)